MATSLQRMTDVHSFAKAVRPWLMRNEVEHNLILSVLRGIMSSRIVSADPYFAVVRRGDEVVGCALRTPPHKLLITRLPADGVTFIVHDVGTVYRSLPAVLGPEDTAWAFAVEWGALKGVGFKAGMNQRLYVLEHVIHPNPLPPGQCRPATSDDVPLAATWIEAFVDESGAFTVHPDAEARRLIEEDRLVFWDRGGPVAMAAVSGRTDHGARIGWVYTEPGHRRNGYAAALVAQLSQRELDAGNRYCMLYTDLANPTSNQIYQRVGYRPVSDIRDFDFGDR